MKLQSWYGEIKLTVDLLRDLRVDLDDVLRHCAPDTAEMSTVQITRLRVDIAAHRAGAVMDGVVAFKVEGLAAR